jgi:hypothetical protein
LKLACTHLIDGVLSIPLFFDGLKLRILMLLYAVEGGGPFKKPRFHFSKLDESIYLFLFLLWINCTPVFSRIDINMQRILCFIMAELMKVWWKKKSLRLDFLLAERKTNLTTLYVCWWQWVYLLNKCVTC